MQQSNKTRIQEHAWLGGKGDPLGTMRETEISSYWQMVYA